MMMTTTNENNTVNDNSNGDVNHRDVSTNDDTDNHHVDEEQPSIVVTTGHHPSTNHSHDDKTYHDSETIIFEEEAIHHENSNTRDEEVVVRRAPGSAILNASSSPLPLEGSTTTASKITGKDDNKNTDPTRIKPKIMTVIMEHAGTAPTNPDVTKSRHEPPHHDLTTTTNDNPVMMNPPAMIQPKQMSSSSSHGGNPKKMISAPSSSFSFQDNNNHIIPTEFCNKKRLKYYEKRHDIMVSTILRMNRNDMEGLQKQIYDEEYRIRQHAKQQNGIVLLLINTYATMCIFVMHLITFESCIATALSVGFTIYIYEHVGNSEDNNSSSSFNGNVMNWVLLSFAIITPISAAVSMAFRRRELALQTIVTMRSTLIHLYISHCSWDWDWKKIDNSNSSHHHATIKTTKTMKAMTPSEAAQLPLPTPASVSLFVPPPSSGAKLFTAADCDDDDGGDHDGDEPLRPAAVLYSTGKERSHIDWVEHTDMLFHQVMNICLDLTRILTLPCSSRARHKKTPLGKKEAKDIDQVAIRLKCMIITRCGKISKLCEILKQEGLPGNEASRIRQWERVVLVAIEQLHVIKLYRTPQGLRSFARLFSMLLPPFFSPYYAQVAFDVHSLGVALTFCTLTSIALTALFETVNQMEDPFDPFYSLLDGIDVQLEVVDIIQEQLLTLRKEFFPNALPYQNHYDMN